MTHDTKWSAGFEHYPAVLLVAGDERNATKQDLSARYVRDLDSAVSGTCALAAVKNSSTERMKRLPKLRNVSTMACSRDILNTCQYTVSGFTRN